MTLNEIERVNRLRLAEWHQALRRVPAVASVLLATARDDEGLVLHIFVPDGISDDAVVQMLARAALLLDDQGGSK